MALLSVHGIATKALESRQVSELSAGLWMAFLHQMALGQSGLEALLLTSPVGTGSHVKGIGSASTCDTFPHSGAYHHRVRGDLAVDLSDGLASETQQWHRNNKMIVLTSLISACQRVQCAGNANIAWAFASLRLMCR